VIVWFLLLSISLLPPADAVAAAARDLASIAPERQAQIRYLALPGGEAKDRQRNAQAIAFLLNSVSRTRTITRPEPLDEQWQLLRIDLAAYADFRQAATYHELFQAWEQLVEIDPYFHLRTQVSTGVSVKTVTTDGGWTGLEAAARLKTLSRSFGAVLRADYFVSQVGGPAYYAWAGVPPKEVDFFKLFGVDATVISNLSADSAANLLHSGVTRKPRRIVERPGVFGGVFQTKDVDAESPDRDPLRNPVDFREQKFNFQASEFFALGANHLWRVALYDGAGNRVDSVPDKVAKDFTGDGIIRPLVSCLRCHERNGGLAGLQPFHDDQFDLLRFARLTSFVPEVAQRIAELYDSERLGTAMARAREDYTLAVGLATGGLTPAAVTDILVQLYSGYVDEQVTPRQAEIELGLPGESLGKALAGSTDPMLLALLAGKSINRAAWESAFATAAVQAETTRKRGIEP
jgi:hypothetical protein